MDEQSIVKSLQAGEPAALEQLVCLHGDKLFRSAVLLCGNEQLAEELVQETFLQAIRAAVKFRGRSAVFTWLYGMLLNVNRKRCRRAFRLVFTGDLPEEPVMPSTASALSVDKEAVANLVFSALRELSVKHRAVIVLHYYEDMSIDDIAAQLRVGNGTVKSRLHYAKERLRHLLPEELNLFAG